MKKERNSLFYYVIGSIISTLGIIIIVIFLTLPLAIKGMSDGFWGWLCVLFVALGLIIFFFGFFYLKKANYIRVKEKNDKSKEDFIKSNKDK